MGDFGQDTAVVGESGRYTAALSSDWDIWGPNGGYIAAVALRAVGVYTELPRPASFACHFLGVAHYEGPVQIEVETIRRTRRAESISVSISQDDKPVLFALAWAIGDVDGLAHDGTTPPDVPRPRDLKSIEELIGEDFDRPYPFWMNVEERPLNFLPEEEWRNRPAGDPAWRHWIRLRPRATFDDVFTDAARLLIPLDVAMWPAACNAYPPGGMTHIAPSLDLFASFHRLRPEAEWMLIDGFSPLARDGLVGGQARVWDEDGNMLCSGGQQMLCRPAPPPR